MHVSVNYYNKEKQPIFTPQRGDGVMKATTHVYVNPADPKNAHHLLPVEYRKAMEKHAKWGSITSRRKGLELVTATADGILGINFFRYLMTCGVNSVSKDIGA